MPKVRECAYKDKAGTTLADCPPCGGGVTHEKRNYYTGTVAIQRFGRHLSLCEIHAKWLAEVNPFEGRATKVK